MPCFASGCGGCGIYLPPLCKLVSQQNVCGTSVQNVYMCMRVCVCVCVCMHDGQDREPPDSPPDPPAGVRPITSPIATGVT